MLPKRWPTVLGLCLLALSAAPLAAQTGGGSDNAAGSGVQPPESLPNAVKAASSLDADQQQQIQQYIDASMALLMGRTPQQIRAGRSAMLSGIEPPTSETFAAYYGDQVIDRLSAALDQGGATVRLNAMIVAAAIRRPSALPLAQTALQDDDAAVRYWGGQVFRRLTQRGVRGGASLTEQHRQTILDTVQRVLNNNPSGAALEPAMLTLSALNIDAADQLLLDTLHGRLQSHAQAPAQSYDAERAAIQTLFRRRAQAAVDDEATTQQIAGLARVACRYALLIANQLKNQADQFSPQRESDLGRMIELTSRILRWSGGAMDASNLPAPLDPGDSPDELISSVQQWQQRLTQAPYGFTETELEVTQ
jgi:hypothetical protein